jgi:hypothetical protein
MSKANAGGSEKSRRLIRRVNHSDFLRGRFRAQYLRERIVDRVNLGRDRAMQLQALLNED